MIKPLIVPAGKSVNVNVLGRFFRVREASDVFQLKVDGDTYTLEGGDEFDNVKNFQRLTFVNLSATNELLVDFTASPNVIRNAFVKLPRTEIIVQPVADMADHDIQAFNGVVNGKRRKQFTLTLRKGFPGHMLVFRRSGHKLMAIVGGVAGASAGFAIETDADLQIQNESGGVIQCDDPNDPDFAVCETFYR